MKSSAALAIVLVVAAVATGAASASEPSVKQIAAARERAAAGEATVFVVAAFVRAHRPHGMTNEPMASGPGFRLLGYAAHRTRYLDVTLLRHNGQTLVRVQADVVWIYPRSPQEKVPANVREIDIKGPRVWRRATNSMHVAAIVRWFDALPISPPGVVMGCPLILWPRIQVVFRSANGTRLASASVPAAKAGLCNAIGFSIHGKPQQPLVDSVRGRGFVDRVAKLLGLRLPSLRR